MSTRPPYNSAEDALPVAPVIEPGHTYSSVTTKLAPSFLHGPPRSEWVAGFAISFTMVMVLTISLAG